MKRNFIIVILKYELIFENDLLLFETNIFQFVTTKNLPAEIYLVLNLKHQACIKLFLFS